MPVGNVDSAMRFPEASMGYQVVSPKDTPSMSAILGRDAAQIRPLNTIWPDFTLVGDGQKQPTCVFNDATR